MNEPLSMRVVEGISEFGGMAKEVLDVERTSHEPICQRLSFEVLHDEKTNRFPVRRRHADRFADVVQRADMRMIEGRDRASFAFEAGPSVTIERKLFGKNLDCDRAIESYVPRFVHFAHA